MRIIRFRTEGGRIAHGADRGDGTARMLEGSIFAPRLTDRVERIAQLLAPLEPPNIICIGTNYTSGREAASDDPRAEDVDRPKKTRESPPNHTLEVFLKPTTALQNPNDPILIPRFDGLDLQLDCEGELAVIVKHETHNISERDALHYLLGYTIANDVTARAFQTLSGGGPPLWMRGKGFDTFCPLGPALVTADEIPDPNDLSLRTIINGQTVREGHTRDMIRSVPEIIACLSRHMTLQPGTVILTGAPPARFTSKSPMPGDDVRVEIDRIGTLGNTVANP